MIARRILILLLMWLIPLYPVLAGTAVRAPSPEHASMQSMHHTMMQAGQDCCDSMADMAHHAPDADSHCSTELCLSHCAISLINAHALAPVLIANASHPHSVIRAFSSITLEPPSRPPSLL